MSNLILSAVSRNYMSLNGLKLRTQVIHRLRRQLIDLDFEEIEPQLFSPFDPHEPTIYPYTVEDYYLPTSPEVFLKQAIAAGLTNCFAISHVFRNLEGEGRLHAPEFILLEWYRRDTTYHQQMDLTQSLVSSILPNLPQGWPTISWRDVWQQYLHVDLDQLIDDQPMIEFAQQQELSTQNATWEQLFNQIADIYIVPHLPQEPFFLIDYPAKISPLAKPRADHPDYAERFELFINGIELANGNTENFNLASIKPFNLDSHLLAILSKLSPQSWSGVGLGIDRLTMLAGGFDHISLVNSL